MKKRSKPLKPLNISDQSEFRKLRAYQSVCSCNTLEGLCEPQSMSAGYCSKGCWHEGGVNPIECTCLVLYGSSDY